MIELAIFDLAGTTVKDNQDVQRTLQQAMAKFGIAISMEQASDVMGIPKPIAIRQLLQIHNHPEKESSALIEAIHDSFIKEMVAFYKYDSSVGEKEGTSETFKLLKQHAIKVAVDTGFNREITDVLLTRLGWKRDNLIDCSVTSDEVLHGRPFPDMVFKAMQLTNVIEVANVAKIGDTISDLQEGNSAGCGLVIAITSGVFSKQVLSAERHTHLIDTIPEVLPILNSYKTLTSP